MRNTIMFMIAAHVLLYASVILDLPILRQCVGFVYLTFVPGFVILGALGTRNKSIAVVLFLSVSLSIAFVMFIGLFVNALYPLFDISAPLSTVPLTVTISALTLAIFLFSQRKEIDNYTNMNLQHFLGEIDAEGAILCAVSVLLLILSIVGALYNSSFLLVPVVAGIATIVLTSIFLHRRITQNYYTFVLFAVSLGLLFQTSLITRHIMGYDIFGEYSVFRSVQAAGYWTPPGIVLSYNTSDILNSVLSVTILPTIYSDVLNLNGEIVFKTIFPFILGLVPIVLYKIYEMQTGKLVALLSAFFFIAEPINWYGLESLSLAREMIAYLFFVAAIFCFLSRDMSAGTKRVLVITFSAALAVSHYSLAFLYIFYIVFAFCAMRIRGKEKRSLDLPLVLCVVAITFAWYSYVSTPALDQLVNVFHNIASRFTQDVFSPQNRLDPGMAALSPLSQTMSLNGLFHKVLIYVTEFFVVVGAVILAIKPNEFRFDPEYRWMAICAAFLLLVCLAVPNVAPAFNFTRFYRATMIFLAPLFILGGMYFLGLFKKIWNPFRSKFSKPIFRNLRLFLLVIILVAFFLFRSGFVNSVTGDRPSSFSLDFNRMKTSTILELRTGIYGIYVPEQDLFSARWLAPRVGTNSLVYAEYGMGVSTLMDYTTLNRQNIDNIVNETQAKPESYVYLRSLNVLVGMVADSVGYFNLSGLSSSLSQNDKIYSNGASDIYFAP